MNRYRIGFLLEQTLGHITFSANLRTVVADDPEIAPAWSLIEPQRQGLIDGLPLLNNWTIRSGWQSRHRLAAMRRQGALDALFFHSQTIAMLSWDWMRRIPSVISLDATPMQFDRVGAAYNHQVGPALCEQVKARVGRACFTAARRIVTWSHWAAESLVVDYGVPAEKIEVIPPGLAVADWARAEPLRPHDGPLRVLFVGGDFVRKGGPQLLQAVEQLPPGSVELHIVTGAAVPERPHVHVHGALRPNSPELRALYRKCDAFCLPTLGDCSPLVLMEAAAAGLPAIATSVGAIPEIVRAGETGLIIPPGDVRALTAALQHFVERPHERVAFGSRAGVLIRTSHDAQRNGRRLLEVIKQAAGRSRVADPIRSH